MLSLVGIDKLSSMPMPDHARLQRRLFIFSGATHMGKPTRAAHKASYALLFFLIFCFGDSFFSLILFACSLCAMIFKSPSLGSFSSKLPLTYYIIYIYTDCVRIFAYYHIYYLHAYYVQNRFILMQIQSCYSKR